MRIIKPKTSPVKITKVDKDAFEYRGGPILHEGFTSQKAPLMKKFVDYACSRLNIDEPKIIIIKSPEYASTNHSFGLYGNNSQHIKVVVHNRNMAAFFTP